MNDHLNRRQFMGGALGVAAVSSLPRIRVAPRRAARPSTAIAAASASTSDGIVVLCTLYGGNDGLNTVVPFDDPAYPPQRGNIAVAPSTLLPLTDGYGLNPALAGMKRSWDAGQLAVVRGVGYPGPSLSHFQSMDIWQSGSTRNDVVSGWLGRWLDRTTANPFHALSIGPNVLPAMVGEKRKASALQDSTSASSQLPYGDAAFLAVYRELQRPLRVQTGLETAVSQAGTNMLKVSRVASNALAAEPPPKFASGVDAGDIGNQLSVVSQIIRAGVPTSAFAVTQGNYDTHAGEVSTQTENLKQLDAAVSTFFASIAGTPHAASTIVVIYSEFGRRVQSNASGGADHGAASNVLVLGPSVHGGFYGEAPSLSALDDNGNLIYNTDYRSVFSTVLENGLGFESKAIFGSSFPTLGFL